MGNLTSLALPSINRGCVTPASPSTLILHLDQLQPEERFGGLILNWRRVGPRILLEMDTLSAAKLLLRCP